ncbi:HigA family addiction module antitoxin [Candidatus Omnitrophota bacterium]
MTNISLDPIIPGDVLKESFIEEYGITAASLADAIGVPKNRIYEIIHGKREITPDTAYRLSCYFGNSPDFWMNLQVRYNMRQYEKNRWKAVKSRILPYQSSYA